MRLKALRTGLFALLICFAVAGCRSNETAEQNRIKVLAYSTEQQFFAKYGNYFAAKFPDVYVEFASSSDVQSGSDTVQSYMRKLEIEKPD